MEHVGHVSLPDDDLVSRLQGRDLEAFETLYNRYADLVFSVSMRIVGDRQVAEDVTQDVFLRLWRRPDHFDGGRGKFIAWLLSVARHRSIDERRGYARRLRHAVPPAVEGEEDAVPDTDVNADPAAVTVLADESRAVRAAVAILPQEQRLVINLAYFGGLTQLEIASKLGQPLGTVKTRIRLGMQKLRGALQDRRTGEQES
jgi:RNA polymerase sigma-70 factor (ECF subfamily)